MNLNYACHYTDEEAPGEALHRIGKLTFIAVELLQRRGVKHRYAYDMQSFLFVLLWVCIDVVRPGEENVRRRNYVQPEQLDALHRICVWTAVEVGEEMCGATKWLDMVQDERWLEIVRGFRDAFGV